MAFNIAGEDYGVPIDQVREIIRFTDVTKVPRVPKGVLGVINLRDQIIPVVSLRERFGFPVREPDNATRIVVSEVAGQTAGFVVDAVTEVLRLPDGSLEPAPQSATTAESALIQGIGKLAGRLIIVLKLEEACNFGVQAG